MSMDTAFAKIATDLQGRDHILIEGTILSLACSDEAENNKWVEAIVRGLRGRGEDGCSQRSAQVGGRAIDPRIAEQLIRARSFGAEA